MVVNLLGFLTMDASSSSAEKLDFEINQPHDFSFPKRQFGKSKIVYRAFQSQWFNKWKWLHYHEANDAAFCYLCMSAVKKHKMPSSGCSDLAFISRGYCNWKDATGEKGAFNSHQRSTCHKIATEVMITLPLSTQNVAELLSSSYVQEKKANRSHLLKVAQSFRFLARQGLALRGDGNEEANSNFMQLLYLRSCDDPALASFLKKKTDRYCCHQIQDELLEVMANTTIKDIASSIKASKFYTIMADEVTDASNREQVVICFRWVDNNFEPHEDFIGLYKVDTIKADAIVAVLKDVILRLNLSINLCRGECYDGAANMAGSRRGAATQILQEESRAIFLHCYGHALNLAASDAIKQSKVLRDVLDTTAEISNLLKYSPRRDALFENIKAQTAPSVPGFRTLCPIRWTVKASSLESVINNYEVFQDLWEEAKDICTDSQSRSRIAGVQAQMRRFEYLFGTFLSNLILRHSDNLSKTLQSPKINASEGQHIAEMTCQTLEKIRNDDSFEFFWTKVLSYQSEFDVDEPVRPRKRKTPRRYEVGESEGVHPVTAKEMYKREYFLALDLIVNYIRDRFNQPGYTAYSNLENLLLKAAECEDFSDEFKFVADFYGSDFDPVLLDTQLSLFGTCIAHLGLKNPTFSDITKYFRDMSPATRTSMSEVCTLVKLILVLPATNAVSERCASALRRVKTYLRTSMSQKRLNNLMTLHNIHRKETDQLSLESCLNNFISGNEHREKIFGQF